MNIIADSSSTRTQWAITDGRRIVESAVTSELNPFFLTRREISHIIRLELPEVFFRRRWKHIYFYGAGCANPDKNKIVSSSLVAQFKTPATVESDMLGAARGLWVRKRGLACILSTGANACIYDGEKIEQNTVPGGYILGDEGSNAYLGKLLVSDVIKLLAPKELINAFYTRFNTNVNEIMDLIYSHPHANRTLATYSEFLAENIHHPYCHDMVYRGFKDFFARNFAAFGKPDLPLGFVGKTGVRYRSILEKAASEHGFVIEKIIPDSMPGLIEYHAD